MPSWVTRLILMCIVILYFFYALCVLFSSYQEHFIYIMLSQCPTMTNNFSSPKSLLECNHLGEYKDLTTKHLNEIDEDITNNARIFMKHTNAQKFCCAKALPYATGLCHVEKPMTFLDVGGSGSVMYTIKATMSNPNKNVNGIVFEIPVIKQILEVCIDKKSVR